MKKLLKEISSIWNAFCSLRKNFLENFFRGDNRHKTILVIISLFAIVFVAYLITWAYCFSSHNDAWTLGGVFLSIFGIFISIGIYIVSNDILTKVNNRQKATISDWLELSIKIIEVAERRDIIYFIAPTFCVGLSDDVEERTLLFEKLCRLIKNKKRNQNVQFVLACLPPNFDANQPIFYGNQEINYLDSIKNDIQWELVYKKVYSREYSKLKTLKEKFDFVYNRYFCSLKENYRKITSCLGDDSIVFLHSDYIRSDSGDDENVFSGFFVSARISCSEEETYNKGEYYLGTFNHDGIETTFKGTMFLNDYIGTEMKSFIEHFLSKNASSSD
jgi:hypothetical protein